MENYTDKINNKPTYKSGISGKSYDNIAYRIKCETACLKQQEEEAKKAAEAKKNADKSKRKKELSDAIEHAARLLDEYMKDYGAFDYEKDSKDDDTISYFWPSKLWHHFL